MTQPKPASTGSLQAIWLKRIKKGPMDSVERALAVVGRGLEGNANQGGKRQITLLSAEAWESAAHQVGSSVDPAVRRANLLIRGLELADSRGRRLQVGTTILAVRGETRPCRQMEESQTGLQEALSEGWRGGIYGEVESGGEIAVGDDVRWLDDETEP